MRYNHTRGRFLIWLYRISGHSGFYTSGRILSNFGTFRMSRISGSSDFFGICSTCPSNKLFFLRPAPLHLEKSYRARKSFFSLYSLFKAVELPLCLSNPVFSLIWLNYKSICSDVKWHEFSCKDMDCREQKLFFSPQNLTRNDMNWREIQNVI